MGVFNKFVSLYNNFDLFGYPITFFFDNQARVKSKFGATFGLLIIAISLYSLSNNFKNWRDGHYYQTISSGIYLNMDEVLNTRNYTYPMDPTVYFPYFGIISFKDNEYLFSNDLKRYFQQYMVYTDEYMQTRKVELENCYKRDSAVFLSESYNMSDDSTYASRYCIKSGQNISLGLIGLPLFNGVAFPELSFVVEFCNNQTMNNTCASEEDMKKMLEVTEFRVATPKTIYDFNNFINPKKRSYNYLRVFPDSVLNQIYVNTLYPIYLMTDNGLLSDDYEQSSIDFNTEKLDYSVKTNAEIEGSTLFKYTILVGTQKMTYFRKNTKVFELIASAGGTINMYLIIGSIFCVFYNSVLLQFHLINISFFNSKKSKSSRPDTENTRSFSFYPMFFASLMKGSVYSEAKSFLFEYLDIKNIVKRLQDIDKLKLILLTNHQRAAFEMLPKPEIGNHAEKRGTLRMDLMTISRKSKQKKEETIHTLEDWGNDDPISKRIYELLDQNIKQDLDEMSKKKIFIYLFLFRKIETLSPDSNRTKTFAF